MELEDAAQLLLLRLQQLSRTVEGKQAFGSAKGEFFVLNYLFEHGNTALPGQLSAGMNVSSARIAALLNTLEERGFLVRSIDPADRRRIDVCLTEAGAEHVRQSRLRLFRDLQHLVEQLGEADTLEYLRITDRILRISAASHV